MPEHEKHPIRDMAASATTSLLKDVVVGLLTSATADLLTRGTQRGKTPEQKVYDEQVAVLIREGKYEDAKKMIEANPFGIGLADELILLSDLIALRRGSLVDDDVRLNRTKIRTFLIFLDGLTESERRKFRHTLTLDRDPAVRRATLITLVNSTATERRQFMRGAGVFEPDLVDEINEMDRQAALDNRRRDREVRVLKRRIRQSRPRPQPGTWTEFFSNVFGFDIFR